MNESESPPPGMWPSRVYTERVRGTGPSLATVARDIAQQLPALLGSQPFCWDVESEPSRRVELDEPTIQQLLGRLRRGRPFLLADRASNWSFLFAIGVDEVHGREYADLSLSGSGEPQPLALAPMMELVTAFARTFDAPSGYVEDSALLHAFVGRRIHERNYANVPPEIRDLVPYEEFRDVPGIAGSVPQLLHRSELPPDQVPSAVYWVNWWSARLIDNLDRARVAGAGWARVQAHADGSMTLAATDHPPDLTRREDIEALASIVRALNLAAVQRRYA